MRRNTLALLSALALSACAAETRPGPVSTATEQVTPASKEPEAANSLPNGAQVNAPLTPQAGTINSVRVGPGAPRRSGY